MSASLVIDRIAKCFGDEVAANDISLSVVPREFIAIVGPSGSGKSTLLRLIAGLETPDSGTITLNGEPVTNLPPHRRDCALVFQHYALFPHRTIRENVGFGLRMRHVPASSATRQIDRLLERVGLLDQGNKRPHQLSGGQQQRVALARALAIEPSLLLLDEPFGALDLSLRRQLQADLRTIQRQDGRTVIHVTHDQSEALSLADRIVVLNQGSVAQIGTPHEIYEQPVNRFVAEFMDFRNLIPVAILPSGPGETRVELAQRPLTLAGRSRPASSRLVAAIRPERVSISTGQATGPHTWDGIVRDVTYGGSTHVHTVVLADGTTIEAHASAAYPAGSSVAACLHPEHLVLLDA